MTVRAEWRKGTDFHEMASALDVNTDQIMAAHVDQGRYMVIFNPDPEREDDLAIAMLERDADHILRLFGQPVPQPGLGAEIRADIEQKMKDFDASS